MARKRKGAHGTWTQRGINIQYTTKEAASKKARRMRKRGKKAYIRKAPKWMTDVMADRYGIWWK